MIRVGLLSLILGFSTAAPIQASDFDLGPANPYAVIQIPMYCQPSMRMIAAASAHPDAMVVVYEQGRAISLISAMTKLAKVRPSVPPTRITGLVVAHKKGDVMVHLGILVGNQVCQRFSVSYDLMNDMLKFGKDA